MSLLFGLQAATAAGFSVFRANFVNRAVSFRYISRSIARSNEENEEIEDASTSNEAYIDPAKDRRNPVPVETSIRYMNSDAYKETYGENYVWKLYRRNHKGMFAPRKTRKTCVRAGIISTGNPCPICRDEYLVLDHRNTTLLKQFISEFNGAVISYEKTGICQKQHKNLLIAITRAKDYGTITFDVPFRHYNYSDWYNFSNFHKNDKEAKNEFVEAQ